MRVYILLALEEVSVAPGLLAVLAGVAMTNTPLALHPRIYSIPLIPPPPKIHFLNSNEINHSPPPVAPACVRVCTATFEP